MQPRPRAGVAAIALSAGAVALAVLGRGTPPALGQSARTDDSAAVAAVLVAARGASPMICELAARSVDQLFGWGGDWSNWGGQFHPTDVALRGRDAATYRRVRDVLGVLRDPGVIDPLRRALGDPDPCVRRIAAPLLGRVQHPRAVEVLRAALRDPEARTRAMAALGLGFAHDVRTIGALTPVLSDANPEVRAMAAWALGEIGSGDGAATPRLVNALGDAEPLVRATAAWALGEIEDRSALPSLTRLLREDDNPDVRKAAAWALGNLK